MGKNDRQNVRGAADVLRRTNERKNIYPHWEKFKNSYALLILTSEWTWKVLFL